MTITGLLVVTTGGTIIPSITLATAAAAAVNAPSHIIIDRIWGFIIWNNDSRDGDLTPATSATAHRSSECWMIADGHIGGVENEISEGRITLLESETAVIGVEKKSYPGGLVELHGMFAAGRWTAFWN